VRLKSYSYRFGEEVLDSPLFQRQKEEIVEILRAIEAPILSPPKKRTRNKKEMIFRTDQKELNLVLNRNFEERGWECQPPVTQDRITGIAADFKKERVQVEVQFGNMARWYTDVFKFQVSYSLGLIDVGVLVVPTQRFANTIDENVAHYERVVRELPYAKMSITLPIWIIGIEPEEAEDETKRTVGSKRKG